MCGIVGYVGFRKALPLLLGGLKKLEYRGYDSCGVALSDNGKVLVCKTKGEVNKLFSKAQNLHSQATLGIGHTRWATHGAPSTINAHPHLDCTGKIAVVHNGIIENYHQLKEKLQTSGHKFISQTDTEVLAHLIEDALKANESLFEAVRKAVSQIVGSYGIAVISPDFPDEIIAARLSSPLIIGLGQGETFLASDQLPILAYTKNLIFLDNGQMVRLTAKNFQIKKLNGERTTYEKFIADEEATSAEKGKFSHFTLKEIHEQPEILKQGLAGRFNLKTKKVKLGGIENSLRQIVRFPYLTLAANGTSYHAGLLGKIFFQKIAHIPTIVENASEIGMQAFPWQKNQPAIFISQSGETADVLTALRAAKKAGVLAFGLVNIVGSSIARETGRGVYSRAGFEVGVASTKSFTSQILALLLWSIALAKEKKIKVDRRLLSQIPQIPKLTQQILKKETQIKKLAKDIYRNPKIFILGRGITYPLALEAALKIKELAYLPAEGMAAGEFKHGPLALIDKKSTLIFLIPDDENFEKNLNSVAEVCSRGGKIIVISNKEASAFIKIRNLSHFSPLTSHLSPPISHLHPLLTVFPMAVFLQLLAFHLAHILNRPIDKPRNLAKSVTVE